MSVIGLTCVLTQRLTRCRSFQASAESTTSRGKDGVVLHSGSYSTQNSTQPMGARATSPSVMYCGRSAALLAVGAAISASITTPAAALRLRIVFVRERIVTPSHFVRDHVSHKVFAAALSRAVQFEVKSPQVRANTAGHSHEYCIKFEVFYFDSNFIYDDVSRDKCGLSAVRRGRCLVPHIPGERKYAQTARWRAAGKPTIFGMAFTRR